MNAIDAAVALTKRHMRRLPAKEVGHTSKLHVTEKGLMDSSKAFLAQPQYGLRFTDMAGLID